MGLVTFNGLLDWISSNLQNILIAVISTIIIYAVYNFSIKQISKLKEQQKLEENFAFFIRRIFRLGAILLLLVVVIFTQFGIRIDVFAGLLLLAGGTVIGFAAMNTLGNALAGLILMTSRPFRIGDRI